MKKFLFLLAFLVSNSLIFAQDLENSKWYFGNQAALDFNVSSGLPPNPLTGSVMNTDEGCASVSDSNGSLLFYTNGDQVWDDSHNQMTNGSGLGGDHSSTQSAVIVPHPADCNIYYIFTSNGSTGNSGSGFYYSTVNIASGEVTSKKNSLFYTGKGVTYNLDTSTSEKLTSYYDSSNNEIWVVLFHSNKVLSYRVDSNGVNDTAIHKTNAVGVVFDDIGSMKVSPNGSRLVISNGSSATVIYDFNLGVVSNGTEVQGLPYAYGVEFSPNSNFIYSSNSSGISQLDISSNLNGTSNLISSGNFGLLQLGIDDKIYAARDGSNYLGVINDPNMSGSGSNFVLNGISLGSNTSKKGLPQKVAKVQASCITDFITTWQVDSTDTSITIPTHPSETYNYDVDWGDGSSSTGVTGDATHSYATAGTYTVKISGDFPRIYFNQGSATQSSTNNSNKIISVEQWGTQNWTSMESAFKGCVNLTIPAIDIPNLSSVTDMSYMFYNANSLNQNINNWDVSNVTDMSYMFGVATSFNQPLNNWDVSNVTNMKKMFIGAINFNQPIGSWFVDNVTDMSYMFTNATNFNQPIGGWNVGNVTDMGEMFYNAPNFNQPINNWDVSNVTNMRYMLSSADSFNQPIGSWDVSNVTDMSHMFSYTQNFNQPIGSWKEKTSNVTNMSYMFQNADSFNQSIEDWNVSNVTNMSYMFLNNSIFNQPLNNWNVENVTNMEAMFQNQTSFNQPLNNWDVSKVTSMKHMFYNSSFNQPIGNWFVDNVTNMGRMFYNSNFNQPIGNWNVSSVTKMEGMFEKANNFDQPLDTWNVSSVTIMSHMFSDANSFNQPIGNWTVDNVTDMSYMFNGAYTNFNQPLGNWNVSSVTNFDNMFRFIPNLSTANYDNLLIGWSQRDLHPNVSFYVGGSYYCNGAIARADISTNYGWTFYDQGIDFNCRITNNKIVPVEDNVIIYPNPTSHSVEVSFKNDINFNNTTIELSNSFGLVLSKRKYTNIKENISFDLSKQPKGIYFLKFTNNEGEITTKKIIKN